jgi:hypothetical protein
VSAPTADRKATGVFSPTRAEIPQRTLRTDRWWQSPLIVDLGFAAFVIYATVRAFLQNNYYVEAYHYLTPFYSPCISKGCVPEASHFWPQILPDVWWLPFAALSLPFLLLFRLTCYYYRGAYYRSVWQSPTACAVAEPHAKYTGETRFPLIIQNTHRYFFYIAGIISVINTYDAIVAFHSPSGFGFGLGNVILVVNVVMLWVYTLSCHSCRHVDVDPGEPSEHPAQVVCVDHPRHADADRLLRRPGGQRHHFRSQIHRLIGWLTALLEQPRQESK